MEIFIFDENVYFWRELLFLIKTFIFDRNFYFWSKRLFLTENFIFWRIFLYLTKIEAKNVNKIVLFWQHFHFRTKLTTSFVKMIGQSSRCAFCIAAVIYLPTKKSAKSKTWKVATSCTWSKRNHVVRPTDHVRPSKPESGFKSRPAKCALSYKILWMKRDARDQLRITANEARERAQMRGIIIVRFYTVILKRAFRPVFWKMRIRENQYAKFWTSVSGLHAAYPRLTKNIFFQKFSRNVIYNVLFLQFLSNIFLTLKFFSHPR